MPLNKNMFLIFYLQGVLSQCILYASWPTPTSWPTVWHTHSHTLTSECVMHSTFHMFPFSLNISWNVWTKKQIIVSGLAAKRIWYFIHSLTSIIHQSNQFCMKTKNVHFLFPSPSVWCLITNVSYIAKARTPTENLYCCWFAQWSFFGAVWLFSVHFHVPIPCFSLSFVLSPSFSHSFSSRFLQHFFFLFTFLFLLFSARNIFVSIFIRKTRPCALNDD